MFAGESLVRGFETGKGACVDRGKGAVISDIHKGVFSHGRPGRQAVAVYQLGHHIGSVVPALHCR